MGLFSKGGGDGGASAQRQAEMQRQTYVRDGTNAINQMFDTQFNDDFYKGRSKAYLDYAKPQVDDQYADARKQLTFALDRSGMLDSTGRTQKEAELRKQYDNANRTVSDKALDYENTARNNVESSRSNLISMLTSTGDQRGAINAATGRAAALTAPDTYDGIGQLFGSFTSALGQQASIERADALGGSGVGQSKIGRYNTGLFANPSSVKVY